MQTNIPATKPPGDGWQEWLELPHRPSGRIPYDYASVEVWRRGWQETCVQSPRDNPHMNAVGLYWRPVEK